MNRFGLVGYPLEHSFSKAYFTKKFQDMGISDTHVYEFYEMEDISSFPAIWDDNPDLIGTNVTIPHKQNVMKFLDAIDPGAQRVGAVNTVKREGDKLVGYNSDYIGFKRSLTNWLENGKAYKCLILGTGGSAKAVQVALEDLGYDFQLVSRRQDKGDFMYTKFYKDEGLFPSFDLVVNTTPIGMYPNVHDGPPIPYESMHKEQFFYDLIYNPEKTLMLTEAERVGARIKNGAEMLVLQAERSWEIWTNHIE
ncbi:MAG: shikimate dehydrogenase [Bacteroidota bacterium]